MKCVGCCQSKFVDWFSYLLQPFNVVQSRIHLCDAGYASFLPLSLVRGKFDASFFGDYLNLKLTLRQNY